MKWKQWEEEEVGANSLFLSRSSVMSFYKTCHILWSDLVSNNMNNEHEEKEEDFGEGANSLFLSPLSVMSELLPSAE